VIEPAKKKRFKIRNILLIPIIAFIIGYFLMDLAQTFKWDVQFLDFQTKNRLDFDSNTKNNMNMTSAIGESSPEERQEAVTALKSLVLPTLTLYGLESASFTSDDLALNKYNALISDGHAAYIYKDRVIHVFVAIAFSPEDAETLKGTLEDNFGTLTVQKINLSPEPLFLDEDIDVVQLEKAVGSLTLLLKEASGYMVEESLNKHKSRAKKIFFASQQEGILLIRQTLEGAVRNKAFNQVRENVLQLLRDHEIYLLDWYESDSSSMHNQWQGLLSELFLYEQLVR